MCRQHVTSCQSQQLQLPRKVSALGFQRTHGNSCSCLSQPRENDCWRIMEKEVFLPVERDSCVLPIFKGGARWVRPLHCSPKTRQTIFGGDYRIQFIDVYVNSLLNIHMDGCVIYTMKWKGNVAGTNSTPLNTGIIGNTMTLQLILAPADILLELSNFLAF